MSFGRRRGRRNRDERPTYTGAWRAARRRSRFGCVELPRKAEEGVGIGQQTFKELSRKHLRNQMQNENRFSICMFAGKRPERACVPRAFAAQRVESGVEAGIKIKIRIRTKSGIRIGGRGQPDPNGVSHARGASAPMAVRSANEGRWDY